jgi:hypothetical protein
VSNGGMLSAEPPSQGSVSYLLLMTAGISPSRGKHEAPSRISDCSLLTTFREACV